MASESSSDCDMNGNMLRANPVSRPASPADTRPYLLEKVDDAAVVQLYADGFGDLSLREKALIWHLYLAAIAGRDIFYDQRYAHNLAMRDIVEAVLEHPEGVDAATLREVRRYAKLFWINTGPYNNLTARKFVLNLPEHLFVEAVRRAAADGARLPLRDGETIEGLCERYAPMFFDASFDPMATSKSPGAGRDILEASANNLYHGVRMTDLDGFVERYPLNSRLVKTDGGLVEEVYRAGGKYHDAIVRIVRHLEDALPFATPAMAEALRALIRFYETGEDKDRERYDIAWVRDQESSVDTINGFVEVYLDARGTKGAWEGLVYYVNTEKTRKIQTLAAHAQWFEDHMPWQPRFRKPEVLGVTATAIEVVVETGDSGPITPVGINLPNDQFIRESYGSKSVSLSNVNEAYDKATPEDMRVEFSWNPEEAARAKQWGAFASELTTEMHEVIGHGSGRMADGVVAPPAQLLKEQFSAIEESRADLVALYFLPDPKLVELGLIAAEDHAEIVRTEYEQYARTALVQLRRVREGTSIEEDHMRNRHMIVSWLMAHTTAIDRRTRGGKTYFVVNDVQAFRSGVAELLAEVQRVKSEGDYHGAKALVETYGVHFDPVLRDEVVARVDALNLPSYTGFVMPRLDARRADDGTIIDVEISYPRDLEKQMLEYSRMTRSA
jgi:dipeptidyl-peptidase III